MTQPEPATGTGGATEPPPARLLALLALGVVSVAFSSIFIRAAEAPAMSIAFYRNAIAAAILLPIALARHRDELRSLDRKGWGTALLAGGLLAAHFALWIPSLSYTTVAASTVLVTTTPVWVALFGRAMGERVGRRTAAGIGLTLAGAVMISGGDYGVSARAALGDLLALAGAVAAAGYLLAGRSLRQRISLTTYTGIAYTTTAAILAVVVAVSEATFTGFEPKVWALFVLMALVPQIGGHTVFNYLLGHVEASTVAIAVTGEPVVASVLALVFFGEVPPWSAVAGGVAILAGIWVVIRTEARARSGPTG
ncbi:MAG TPA: DMT family transporter [Actinomycetota bacterium]|nr:DMT family transporter [Actinomycetota bacterium]